MKRFLLFCGENYYPNGGWADFKGDFDSLEEAFQGAFKSKSDWYHIVDAQDARLILNGLLTKKQNLL